MNTPLKDAEADPSTAQADPVASTLHDHSQKLFRTRLRHVLTAHIQPAESHLPLLLFCFWTGYIDAISFTAARVWAGFQTGNTIDLAIALARTFSGHFAPTSGFQTTDGFCLVSLLSFLAGAAILQVATRLRIIDTTGWHVLASLLCAALTLIASALLINGYRYGQGEVATSINELGWSGARGLATMGFLSASLGLQGALAKRLNTSFATTVVLTSVWIDIVTNPNSLSFRRTKSRDQRVSAILFVFLGGFTGRALHGALGAAAALGLGAGLRALSAFTWLLVPSAPQ